MGTNATQNYTATRRMTLQTVGSAIVGVGVFAGVSTATGRINVPDDRNTTADAIDVAQDGDTIFVKSGEYHEGTLIIEDFDDLTLRGEGPQGSDLGGTSIVREGGTYGLQVRNTEGVTLEDFRLTDTDHGDFGYGLKLECSEDLSIRDVHAGETERTAVDLNTIVKAHLENVFGIRARNGKGIAIRNSSDVTVSASLTKGNAWGGLAFYAPDGESTNQVSVLRSNFSNEQAGIYLQHTDHNDIRIEESDLIDNDVGLAVFPSVDGGEITANLNNITGNNDYGVVNNGDGKVDARRCWWGDRRGPENPRDRRDGDGDKVSENVKFDPHHARPV